MTVLTAAQTRAVVEYLRRVQATNMQLGGGNETVAGVVADALEAGLTIVEVTAELAHAAALNIALGNAVQAGIESGYIAGLNMVKAVVTAKEQPLLADYADYKVTRDDL